jgi:hypothetical protein
LGMYGHNTFSVGPHFASQSPFTATGRNDESSLSITSSTFSTFDCYGRIE